MLHHPMKNKTFIHSFDWEYFLTTMLALWLFIAHEMAVVFMEVIEDIQCYIFIIIKVFQITKIWNKLFPTTIFAYLVT